MGARGARAGGRSGVRADDDSMRAVSQRDDDRGVIGGRIGVGRSSLVAAEEGERAESRRWSQSGAYISRATWSASSAPILSRARLMRRLIVASLTSKIAATCLLLKPSL